MPLAYVSPTQINAQIPSETQPGQATVTVVAGDRVLPPIELTVQPIAPSLFVDGQNHVIAQNQDGTANGANHPAAPGTLLTTYLTGQGALKEQIPDGAAARADPPIMPQAPMTAAIGGRDVEVVSARMAGGMVGVLEVTIEIPSVNAGDYFLTVDIGGAASNSGVVTVGTNWMDDEPIITLTTDFGLSDHFVGVMKGVILGIQPSAQVIDISHGVQPYEIADGAFTIAQAYRYFPKKTIHVVVVDPGVGIGAAAVAG